MDEKRMIGDYTVLNTMYVGHKEIAICENPKAESNERYLCCYVENVAIFERYTEGVASDDFAEIAKVFGERIISAADEIMKETEKAEKLIGENTEIMTDECNAISYMDSIENKVVVIKGNILRPEFRHASHQLMLCTGGFGSQPNARGRTCYCISLYDGKKTSYYRSDILGTMDKEMLPEWAKDKLEKAKEIHEAEKKPPKERGEAR